MGWAPPQREELASSPPEQAASVSNQPEYASTSWSAYAGDSVSQFANLIKENVKKSICSDTEAIYFVAIMTRSCRLQVTVLTVHS